MKSSLQPNNGESFANNGESFAVFGSELNFIKPISEETKGDAVSMMQHFLQECETCTSYLNTGMSYLKFVNCIN